MSLDTTSQNILAQKKEYQLEEFKNLSKEIKTIDQWVNYATNNGLFVEINKPHARSFINILKKIFGKKIEAPPTFNIDSKEVKDNRIYDEIQNEIENARNNLTHDEYCEGRKNISKAVSLYNSALYSTTKTWRFVNLYGGLIWLYLTGFLSLVLVFYASFAYAYFHDVHGIEEAAIHAVTWGCIGGILRGLWYLKDKVSERKYKNSWWIFFLSVPFLGGIFGAIIYLIIVAGLLSLGVGQGDSTLPEINRPLVVIPIAALVGFNWEWAITIFKRIGDALAPNPPKE